mmetsp:Transcript_14955/g.58585  ORF Transcript_14955/g.58585 Transcript_14955/m.58585 type:complete len:235 (+) Transcript_14955:1953-2657(+)
MAYRRGWALLRRLVDEEPGEWLTPPRRGQVGRAGGPLARDRHKAEMVPGHEIWRAPARLWNRQVRDRRRRTVGDRGERGHVGPVGPCCCCCCVDQCTRAVGGGRIRPQSPADHCLHPALPQRVLRLHRGGKARSVRCAVVLVGRLVGRGGHGEVVLESLLRDPRSACVMAVEVSWAHSDCTRCAGIPPVRGGSTAKADRNPACRRGLASAALRRLADATGCADIPPCGSAPWNG